MLKIKDSVDLKELEKFGFEISHVAVYPTKLVKVVDLEKKLIITICNEEPNYNMWSGRDVNDSRILKLWECKVINENSVDMIVLEPDVKEHLYYETIKTNNKIIKKYVKDLIKADLVEKVEEVNND